MAEAPPWYADVVLPALMRGARRTYGTALRAALAEVGCDDMPRNGSFVVGAIARSGSPLGDVIKELGISKQRAGQLVDALVTRGYLERATDPADRRRMTVSLTERGSRAASAGWSAIQRVDADLTARVGAEAVMQTRRTLGALIEAGAAGEADG